MSIIIKILNGIIYALGSGLSFILSCLPQSPFTSIDITPIKSLMGYFNWLIPVGTIVAITGGWVACKFAYWVYSTVLRWIKLIS